VTARESKFAPKVKRRKQVMRYIGVDLHSNNFMVCVLSDNEEPTFRQYKFAELHEFKDLLQTEDRIAVEATARPDSFTAKLRHSWLDVSS
jgi:hypothetical protein